MITYILGPIGEEEIEILPCKAVERKYQPMYTKGCILKAKNPN